VITRNKSIQLDSGKELAKLGKDFYRIKNN
jgi:hypothetical protein